MYIKIYIYVHICNNREFICFVNQNLNFTEKTRSKQRWKRRERYLVFSHDIFLFCEICVRYRDSAAQDIVMDNYFHIIINLLQEMSKHIISTFKCESSQQKTHKIPPCVFQEKYHMCNHEGCFVGTRRF